MIGGKRICVVVHYEGMSGALRSLPPRLGQLAREATFEFVVPGPGQAERELRAIGEVGSLGYAALTFPGTPLTAPAHLGDLGAQVRRFRAHFRYHRPDLVVVTSMMVPAAARAARAERIPVLIHASELLNAERLPSRSRRAVARVFLRTATKSASVVIACSRTVAAQFERSGVRVETIYPPIAEPCEVEGREGLRRRYGIQPHQSCVAVVGNITRGRGQDLLLKALPLIRARLPGTHCLVAGEPFERQRDLDYRSRLTNLCRGLGVEDAVHFVGVVDPVADVYAAADVVVNPARMPESFGRVACEALLAGRPVVATAVGATQEVLDHGRTALLVKPDDPAALAATLVELIENPALASELVKAGRDEVLHRFSVDEAATRFRQIAVEVMLDKQEIESLGDSPAALAEHEPTAEAAS